MEIVWLVWPEDQQVEIWRPSAQTAQALSKTDTLAGEGALTGFSYPLARLFAALL